MKEHITNYVRTYLGGTQSGVRVGDWGTWRSWEYREHARLRERVRLEGFNGFNSHDEAGAR